jgi:hypothetical protein
MESPFLEVLDQLRLVSRGVSATHEVKDRRALLLEFPKHLLGKLTLRLPEVLDDGLVLFIVSPEVKVTVTTYADRDGTTGTSGVSVVVREFAHQPFRDEVMASNTTITDPSMVGTDATLWLLRGEFTAFTPDLKDLRGDQVRGLVKSVEDLTLA